MAATDSFEFDTIEGKQIPALANLRIFDGRYLLTKRLGSGGYSVVYQATDLHSPRRTKVAVKCLLHDTASHKAKIQRELSLHGQAAPLPGVVDIFHTGEEHGLFFIVMEYCPDGDLFSMVTELRRYLGKDELIKRVFLQLLDTVHALHRMGIYHRDLKPENVLCSKGGERLRISDFGLATTTEKSANFGCGSYFYMSPECLAGFYSSAISGYSSRAADIWALGVILINLITSRSPWKSAVLSDPSYARYIRNHTWLRQMLPLSGPAFEFLDHIFASHGNVSLTLLREQFLRIDSFYMSKSELKQADPTARLVASDWQADAPVDDIKEEDIMEPVDEEALFEDKVDTPPKAPVDSDFDSLKSLSPVSPGSDISESSPPDSSKAETVNDIASPPCAQTIAGQLYLQAMEDAEDDIPPSLSTSSSVASSEYVVTPETLPAQDVDVVADLPEGALGEKLVSVQAANKQSAVKSVVARGGNLKQLLSKVRMVL